MGGFFQPIFFAWPHFSIGFFLPRFCAAFLHSDNVNPDSLTPN
jgi:hypothetical protein